MAVLLANIWRIGLMLGLLCLSAFFSGSETAFFNISRRQLQAFGASKNRLEKTAAQLLRIPNRLLTSILLGNMAVNVLFFALSSVLAIQLAQAIHPAAAGVTAAASFAVLLLFGEMLPKSLAYSHSIRFSLVAAPFCYVFVRALAPLLAAFEWIVVKPAVRLLTFQADGKLAGRHTSVDQLKMLIETTRKEGLITRDENQLLLEILEFSRLKVRHVMQPRVDMPACDIAEPAATILAVMHRNRLHKIPLYSGNIDNMVGTIHIRNLLLEPDKPLESLLDPIDFVPEQKTVESLIQFFRQRGRDMAIVVDEYGGIAGQVVLDDIISELIEPLTEEYEQSPAIEQLGPMRYRLAGDLAIHDWANALGIEPEKSRVATLGGFVAGRMGRIPRPGDAVRLDHVTLTVEKVYKRRVQTLILTLEPIGTKSSQ
ncbi:MAG: HlyC/CorC family transporter [Phycisphaerae bacterium]|nr:HlyC/CorC family transporter [Phycisphaerae bacterium]